MDEPRGALGLLLGALTGLLDGLDGVRWTPPEQLHLTLRFIGPVDERAQDLAAVYPEHSRKYRDAYESLARFRKGNATTEDLRQAIVSFRSVIEKLLGGRDEKLKRAS